MTHHAPARPPVRFVAHAGAGRGAFARRWPPIAAALAARGLEHTVELTTRPGEATELARRAARDGARLVVAVGGDGTLHEVVNGLLGDTRPPVPLVGLVSAGRGSDYARGTGMPVDAAVLVDRFARALEGDRTVVHDVDAGTVSYRPTRPAGGGAPGGPAGESTSRWFVNAAGIGISPFIARRVSRFPARLGSYLYTVAGLVTIVDWRDRLVELGWDDGSRDEVRVESVEVALGPYEGGGMWVAPAADPSDGFFDVVVVGAMSRLETLTFTWRIRTGDHLRSPAVSVRRTRSLTVRALDEAGAIYLQADGELLGHDPFRFDIAPAALRLVW
jgi:diacylglycerol kinase (ATP)